MNGYDMNYSQARKFDSYGVEPKNQYEGLDNGDPINIQEFHLTKNEHYNSSSSTVPSNLRMVDSNVSRQMYEPSPRNKRTNTKVIHETLDDGTVISRQIVVEEEETLVERRLYKYEPTSPLMNRKHDPASAMAVQTGVHQAADLGYEGDEHTRSNSKSSSRTSHWMPSSSKLNDEIPVPPRPANYRPSTSSQHQVYEGVNMGHATDTSLNGAVNASSPTRKFPNLASPNSTNSDTESTNRGFEGPNGCNHSVVSPTQMVYREKRFPVADVSPYRAEQNNNPNGCPPYNEHIYKSVQSSNITGFPHPSEKEFESLDPNSKFNLIKNLTDGDYAYRTFDSNRGTHSSRSTGADKANRNADLHGQLSSEKPRSRSKLGYNESFRNATKEDLYCNEIEMGEASQGMSSLYGRSGPDYEATGLQSLRVRDDIPNASGPKSAGPVVGNVNEHRVYASSTGDLLKAQKPLNVKSDHDLNASMNTYDTPTGSDENFRHNFHPKGQHQRNRSDIIQKESLTTHGFPIVNTHSSGSGSMAANATRNLSVDNIVSAGNSDALGNYDNAGKYARQQKQQRSSENMFNRPETAVTTTTTVREPVSQRMQSLFPNEVNAQNIASERVAQPRRGVVEKQFDPTHAKPNSSYGNQLAEMVLGRVCARCLENLKPGQDLVTSGGDIYHQECFVCAHCFLAFPNGVYFDFENRKYCEDDFNLMFAPSCGQCGEFVKGRVIKAMGRSWHPDCFKCSQCSTALSDVGFHSVKSRKDEAFCKNCADELNALESGKRFCGKCQALIENDGLRFKSDWFHAYHFNCDKCNAELTPTARESDGKLYCLKCSDSKTCALCRRTIEKYERSLIAMNKNWHPDCFRCSFCNKPFNGDKHFVYNAQPYCEEHYNQLFGNLCFYCNKIIPAPGVSVDQKMRKYCEHHFECFFCSKALTPGVGDIVMLDGRPVCMKCTQRFPGDFKSKCFKSKSLDVGVSGNAKAKLLNPFKKK